MTTTAGFEAIVNAISV